MYIPFRFKAGEKSFAKEIPAAKLGFIRNFHSGDSRNENEKFFFADQDSDGSCGSNAIIRTRKRKRKRKRITAEGLRNASRAEESDKDCDDSEYVEPVPTATATSATATTAITPSPPPQHHKRMRTILLVNPRHRCNSAKLLQMPSSKKALVPGGAEEEVVERNGGPSGVDDTGLSKSTASRKLAVPPNFAAGRGESNGEVVHASSSLSSPPPEDEMGCRSGALEDEVEVRDLLKNGRDERQGYDEEIYYTGTEDRRNASPGARREDIKTPIDVGEGEKENTPSSVEVKVEAETSTDVDVAVDKKSFSMSAGEKNDTGSNHHRLPSPFSATNPVPASAVTNDDGGACPNTAQAAEESSNLPAYAKSRPYCSKNTSSTLDMAVFSSRRKHSIVIASKPPANIPVRPRSHSQPYIRQSTGKKTGQDTGEVAANLQKFMCAKNSLLRRRRSSESDIPVSSADGRCFTTMKEELCNAANELNKTIKFAIDVAAEDGTVAGPTGFMQGSRTRMDSSGLSTHTEKDTVEVKRDGNEGFTREDTFVREAAPRLDAVASGIAPEVKVVDARNSPMPEHKEEEEKEDEEEEEEEKEEEEEEGTKERVIMAPPPATPALVFPSSAKNKTIQDAETQSRLDESQQQLPDLVPAPPCCQLGPAHRHYSPLRDAVTCPAVPSLAVVSQQEQNRTWQPRLLPHTLARGNVVRDAGPGPTIADANGIAPNRTSRLGPAPVPATIIPPVPTPPAPNDFLHPSLPPHIIPPPVALANTANTSASTSTTTAPLNSSSSRNLKRGCSPADAESSPPPRLAKCPRLSHRPDLRERSAMDQKGAGPCIQRLTAIQGGGAGQGIGVCGSGAGGVGGGELCCDSDDAGRRVDMPWMGIASVGVGAGVSLSTASGMTTTKASADANAPTMGAGSGGGRGGGKGGKAPMITTATITTTSASDGVAAACTNARHSAQLLSEECSDEDDHDQESDLKVQPELRADEVEEAFSWLRWRRRSRMGRLGPRVVVPDGNEKDKNDSGEEEEAVGTYVLGTGPNGKEMVGMWLGVRVAAAR